MTDAQTVLAQTFASKRQKLMKRIYHQTPEIFDNPLALEYALKATDYFKICAQSKVDPVTLIAFDMAEIQKYLEYHHENLLNNFLHMCAYNRTLSTRKQQQNLKVYLILLKVSYDKMTYRVGASQRARIRAQKAQFGSAVKDLAQNPVLAELRLQGLGSLDKGRSHKATAELNVEREQEGKPAARSRLTFWDFRWFDVVADDFDFITYLVQLKLIDSALLEYVHLTPEKQFAALMDALSPGMRAFNEYCGEAAATSAVYRREISQELVAAKSENREPIKPKKEYKKPEPIVIEETEVVETPQPIEEDTRLTWRDLTQYQQDQVKANRATFYEGKWTPGPSPEPFPEDLSWGFALLDEDYVPPAPAPLTEDEICQRVATGAADLLPEARRMAVYNVVYSYLIEGGSVVKAMNSIFDLKGKADRIPFTHDSFLQGLESRGSLIPLAHVDEIDRTNKALAALRLASERAAQEVAEQNAQRKQQTYRELLESDLAIA